MPDILSRTFDPETPDSPPVAQEPLLTRLEPWFVEARALMALGAPLVLTQLAQMAMPTTDVIMIGALGQDALAASAIATSLYIFVWLGGLGPSSAVAPIIAHILGAHPADKARVRASVRMGLWAILILAPFLSCVLLFAEPLLLLFGQTPELAHRAAPYAQILAIGLPFSLGFNVLRNFSTALGHARAPLIVMFITVLVNAGFDYGLIFGHFGMPRLGYLGAAATTTCANIFSFVTMLAIVLLAPTHRPFRILRRFHRPDWAKLTEIFRLGASIGLTMIFEIALFAGAIFLMGRFGTAAVAAHQIALNVPSVTFMVPLGLANATAVRVGLAAGAGDAARARRAGFAAILLAIAFMTCSAIVIASAPRAIVGLYLAVNAPENAEATALAVTYLYVAAAFQIFDAIQVTASFALRGLKDARVPAYLAAASYWGVGFPAALVMGFVLDWKGLGIWLGLALSLLVAAVTMSLRFAYLSGATTFPKR